MSIKPFKIVGYLTLAGVVGVIGYIGIGVLFFVQNEKRLDIGCEQGFCVEQTKAQVAALFEGQYSFDNGIMVPYDPTIEASQYRSTNHANSLEELLATDRWTIVYDKKKGWRKFVHLEFQNEVLDQIHIVNYGPFYIDP